ncbi:hypothetical protein HanRHA438_Chr03g0098071 [Helianthus annuus]|uniref:Uncharacterized protein n=1 Tax=Helianthus annuus TaxID=4232 RepID=A0A251V3T4_HELAN|nr:uncharacterized protein LOC110928446 [Helianthus annuus]KAF5812483.1 hypothetical protein HanXRQr2_Chr03g0086921 [Helianthus annuus]KAJ0495630.1 hypothetical protein HanIR_Chr12g0611061 [Helianthus annuus]KAJ0606322.1 hypothetical protein HanHA89_Chr03g0083801 [Helianthus annuus]KAJ0933606.1 hypothetical protein HanRHA438_Chr03g0098071 [Helianthus annuus]
MVSSGKSDLSSCSPRPLYKRGSHTVAAMDRSASFRGDNMENPILSSLPSMSRSSVNVSQGDVTNFFQCLRFDLKSMAAEYKCNRHGDFKRLATAALCAPDDSPSGLFKGKRPFSSPENLKRFKVGLRESTIKARERVKIFSDVLSVINKCFPCIPSRKRSRPDAFSAIGKMASTQNHAVTSVFDFDQQKVEERVKNGIPNKRTRTSMVDQRTDVRPNTPARSSGSVDRVREVARLPNSNTLESVDRALPIVADGWEKAKMKKKRTGIKTDVAPSTSSVLAKPIDRSRMHPRSRSNDLHEFRPGVANGVTRSSIPNTPLLHVKKDQTTNLEHERTVVKAFNKGNDREDFISGTPSSTPKVHAIARGPRSGSGVVPKLTHGQHPVVSNGSTNRKRGLSTRSSSPPVAQWADRRPQKISRTARRTNLIPVLSTNDEIPPSGNRVITNSPKQFKSKGVCSIQSSTPSESEESGVAEIRPTDNFKSVEVKVEDKDGLNVQKMSTLVLPTRKNKFMNQKQHRNGRSFASVRSVGNVGTEKHLRTDRVGFDKPESKVGRPPTRKLSGRKAYTRQKHFAFTAATDFVDDGHEELLAAANAVINPVYTSSSPFWRQMDPLFGFVSDAAVTYLKQEGSIRSTVDITNPIDNCDAKNGTESSSECSGNLTSPRGISLCRRLLAALISEDDNNEELNCSVYGSAFEAETDLIGGGFSSSYRIDYTLRSCNEVDSAIGTGFDDCYNGLHLDSYSNTSFDEKLVMEIHSLGLYPEPVPDLVHGGDEDINNDISRLEEKHHQQVFRKKNLLDKLLKSTEEAREQHQKEFERLSLEKLTEMAYQKYMSCWGKSTSGKMAKQAPALNFVKRTLNRCREFQTTGKSCFSEPLFKDIFHSRLNHTQVDDDVTDDQYRKADEKFSGTQLSSMHPSEQSVGKDNNIWSSRSKKRELYLDDVPAGMTCTSPGVGRVIINSVKGKRSERDPRNGGPKVGRPAKAKSKLKQKTTQLSSSVDGKFPDHPRAKASFVPKPTMNEKDECLLTEEEEPLDLSHLQLPEMVDFGGQGEDIGSWLNIDDDIFPHDDDFMGLEIPMDDLTDLNMMV